MTLPSWPSSLPELRGIADSTGTERLGGIVTRSTQMDDGPPRVRRQTLFSETPRKMSLRLERDEFATLEAFVRVDLNGSARRFTAPVILPNGTVATRTCRIIGDVSASEGAVQVSVTFTLGIRDWF